MLKRIRVECPLDWIDSQFDGSRNFLFFSNFLIELSKKGYPIQLEKAVFGADASPRFPENGEIVFSYHSRLIKSNEKFKVYHLKEAPIPPLYSIDLMGYSGWSEMGKSSGIPAEYDDVISKYDDLTSRKIIGNFANSLVGAGFSKYPQRDITSSTNELDGLEDYVFFPLQVQTDPVAELSRFNIIDLLEEAASSAKRTQTMLLIKRHPFDKSKVIDLLISKLTECNPYVKIVDGNIHVLNKFARSVISVNSGSSIEAIIANKSVWNAGTSEWWSIANRIDCLEDVGKAFLKPQPTMSSSQAKTLAFLLDHYWVPNDDRAKISARIDWAIKQFEMHEDRHFYMHYKNNFELRRELKLIASENEKYRQKLKLAEMNNSLCQKQIIKEHPEILISVVVPYYKTQEFLDACLTSLVSNFRSTGLMEIILVDDGSPFDAQAILEKFDSEKVKTVYIKHQKNSSLLQARVTGFLAAKGKYVITVDSDDELLDIDSVLLSKLINQQQPDIIQIGLVTGKIPSSVNVDVNHIEWGDLTLNGHNQIWNHYLEEKHWSVVGRFFRRDFLLETLSKIDISHKYVNIAEDFALTTCLMFRAKTFYRRWDLGKYFYRTSEDSLTRNRWYSKEDSLVNYLTQYENVYSIVLDFLGRCDASVHDIERINKLWASILGWVLPLFKDFLRKENIINLFFRVFPPVYSLEYLIKSDFDLASDLILKYKPEISSEVNHSKKIAFIVNSLSRGGAERATANLARLLSQHEIEVVIVTNSEIEADYDSGNVTILSVKRTVDRNRQLLDFFRKEHINTLIFVDHWILDTFDDILYFSFFGFRIISQEHSSFWFPLYTNQNQLFFRRKTAYKHCEYLTCLNEYDVSLWKNNGIQQAIYVPNLMSFQITNHVHAVTKTKTLLFVGRLTKLKGIEFIPMIIQKIARQFDNFRVYLCGDFTSEEEKNTFYKELKTLGVERFVASCGWRPDLEDLYKTADVLMVTSYVEGSPMVINEARANGIPIVMFDLPYIDNINQGVLVAPMGDTEVFASKVVSLLKNKVFYESMSQDARQGLDPWTPENVLQIWKHILEEDYLVSNLQSSEGRMTVNMQMFYQALNYKINQSEKVSSPMISCASLNFEQLTKIRRYDQIACVVKKFFPDNSYRKKVLMSILKKCNKILNS